MQALNTRFTQRLNMISPNGPSCHDLQLTTHLAGQIAQSFHMVNRPARPATGQHPMNTQCGKTIKALLHIPGEINGPMKGPDAIVGMLHQLAKNGVI